MGSPINIEKDDNGQPKLLYSMKQLNQLHHFTNYG